MSKSTTDTDSSSTDSSRELERKRKLLKKLKKKSEKKSKKHKKEKKKKSRKEKKRARKETSSNSSASSNEEDVNAFKPKVISSVIEKDSNEVINDAFGPALPPHLINKNQNSAKQENVVIGPVMPIELMSRIDETIKENSPVTEKSDEEENLKGSYGPLPINNETGMTAAQIELEQRALELKMAALDGINAPTTDTTVREEWMLELPEVGLKGGLAALSNMKRGFHQGKEKPDFSDRSSWTKTPQTGNETQKPSSSKNVQQLLEQQAQALYEKQRDAEQEAIAKKHKKKHKRDESLVEIHQKKLRKEEKKKAKELKESGAKPERRPFTRDIDLKLNKIDRNQTKQIVDKAKILNTKFSSGHSKYL